MRHAFIVSGLLRAALVVAALHAAAPTAQAQGDSLEVNPVIFVHGGSGSGAQFESQAMRFNSNGYPQEFVRALEYDSSSIMTILPDVLNGIDDLVAELQMLSGRPQVDLVGHSLGTFVSQSYLATPSRAANIGHYANVDGRTATSLPGNVPTLALFAGAARAVQGEIVGGTNVTLPDQEHVEAVTSKEAFVEMFRFFTDGLEPQSADIIPEAGPFPVSGRAVLFPQNVGVRAGSAVMVFKLDPDTGRRNINFFGMYSFPADILMTAPDGSFGPTQVDPGVFHEFTIVRPGLRNHMFYMEPFVRRDSLVRLNTGIPGEGLDLLIDRDPNSAAIVIVRNREFRGDRGVADNDVLAINGTDIMNPATAPSGFVGSPVAEVVFDVRTDGVSNVASPPAVFGAIGFIGGVDLFLPTSPFGRSYRIDMIPRGNVAGMRTINIPNTPSTAAAVSVNLNDFDQ